MRLGTVIGQVTLSVAAPALEGARWLVVSPKSKDTFDDLESVRISADPSLIVYDDLGGGNGDTIGYIEGREAASVFKERTPIDAINAALIDHIFYSPKQ